MIMQYDSSMIPVCGMSMQYEYAVCSMQYTHHLTLESAPAAVDTNATRTFIIVM
jgi:hypothetical protein